MLQSGTGMRKGTRKENVNVKLTGLAKTNLKKTSLNPLKLNNVKMHKLKNRKNKNVDWSKMNPIPSLDTR